MKKIVRKIIKQAIEYRRIKYLTNNRNRLTNHGMCLVSSNCNGAMILNDLGERFNSPFVNLWIYPKDYIKMLNSLKEYMEYELTFVTEEGIDYPIGVLKDIKIYFQHYASENEAREKWNSRKKRMNYDNLFVLFTDRDGCTEQDLIDFDNLPYEKKVVFVHKPCPNILSSVYISGFERDESVGFCMEYRGKYSAKRYYNDFDFVNWFNK